MYHKRSAYLRTQDNTSLPPPFSQSRGCTSSLERPLKSGHVFGNKGTDSQQPVL